MGPPLSELPNLVLRLLAAAAFGGVIGWNRERGDKPAGLRTFMLVSLGSACFTLVMLEMLHHTSRGTLDADPTRVIQGVAAGIGFLGAGSIWRSGGQVKGLTTAAGIWVVGAIGIACGAGLYLIAAITVFFTLLILTVVVRLERWISPDR